jgi:hypothetical protein
MSNHDDRLSDAIRTALESRAGNLLSIARTYFPEIKPNGYLKKCPWCEKSDKFAVKRAAAGHWYWGCHNPSCQVAFDTLKADRMGDAIGLICLREGKSRDQAIDSLLSLAGIPNPRQDNLGKKSPRKPKPKPAPTPEPALTAESTAPATPPSPSPQPEPPPTPAPADHNQSHEAPAPDSFSLTGDPDLAPPPETPQTTVWDDIFSRLSLTASDRENLKRQRGFSRETIETAGYRSSTSANRTSLQHILDNYPLGILLSEGIAVKDTETGAIKINAQLCGWGLKKRGSKVEKDIWDWTNPVLIPYRNKHGNIISIRPHKGGLSGKRFMREHGFEHAFRSTRTRTKLYTNHLFWNRPEGWEKRCVLTEGEHKANALAQCGIPAAAVPGIQMPRNEIFLDEMIDILRDAGIRDVIVCYDNEDKSHKPDPWDRYDVEVYAYYACDALRGKGFHPYFTFLPDEWRIDGKADWDSALAQFGPKAEAKFKAVLKKAKPYFPQLEIFGNDQKFRIVQCKLNRLTMKPQILTGGDAEEDLARLILKTSGHWRREFQIIELAELLRNTRGCYFTQNKPPKDVLFGKKNEEGLYDKATAIRKAINECPAEDLDIRAELEAALAACQLLIKGKPEIITDFTIHCEFQVRTQENEVHRLFRFKNKHGQTSQLIQVPPAALSTSSKFREFCMGIGNFNPTLGDKHLQQLMQDIGQLSAWREIRSLSMLGRDPESNLWIFGDCAFAPDADLFAPLKPGQDPEVIFVDKHDVAWHQGTGYRLDPEDLSSFAHRYPPKFFQALGKTPQEVYQEIKDNPKAEQLRVAWIFLQLAADLIHTFGDASGLLILGGILGYAMAPELLQKYHGHPGIWIHGRQYSGKSETSAFLMQCWGFPSDYKTFVLSGGTTAAFIDRVFAQYSDVPVHADEFRQKEADETRIASLRSPFGRQSKGKALMDSSNKTRLVNPRTSPLVTGEGVTKDAATLSRYIEAVLATDKRLGTKSEQHQRYNRMLTDAQQYHKIIRYVLLNRKWYGKAAIENLNAFMEDRTVSEVIKSERPRIAYGTAYCAFQTLMEHFLSAVTQAQQEDPALSIPITRQDLSLLIRTYEEHRPFTINYACKAAADVLSINFIVKFWSDVVTYSNINPSIRRFIWFERCIIDDDNKVTITNANTDVEGTVRCVIIKAKELYAEFQKESRQRGHEPELAFNNLRSECRHERYWVPAPTSTTRQAHRIYIKEHGTIDVWVLRLDRMDPTVEAIFAEKFELDGEDDGVMPML